MTPQEQEAFFDDVTQSVKTAMTFLEGNSTGFKTFVEGVVNVDSIGVLKIETPTIYLYFTDAGRKREGERLYNAIKAIMVTHNVAKFRFEKELIANNTYKIMGYIVDESGQVIDLQ